MTPTPVQSYAGKVRAPEFPTGLDWLNVDRPLSMADLRGKVVLLDFWTYGCINCIHIIPDLKRLEAEFAAELIVIGVHSAKFKNEGETENIRYILKRYEVTHPVVNDRDFVIWQSYGVRAWPTIMVIDPQGKVLGYYSGEGVYDALRPVVAAMIAEFDARGQINRAPIPLAPELNERVRSLLNFPGKVLADPANNRLFISDTNHHRVIMADLTTYSVQAVIGSGIRGWQDGDWTTARFDWPHGLAAHGDTLYVADTGNHALRAVDLNSGAVTTIAGTGRQNTEWGGRLVPGPALQTALNSPWDVVRVGEAIYIAMAGPHQIWSLDLKTGIVGPFVGSGREGLVDGPLLAAELAQPSGIASDGAVLYFADAESSAIRQADLAPDGRVRTIVGTGLFDFGDVDGIGDAARLQHALGLTIGPEGKLYVADTYNSKIKVIDPVSRESRTLFGGARGYRDGKAPQFWEPGGISYANGKLFIADTNNDVIRVADLTTGEVSTLLFPNPDALSRPGRVGGAGAASGADVPPAEFFGEIVNVPPMEAAPGQAAFVLDIQMPEGYKFNNTAPFTLRYYNDNAVATVTEAHNNLRIVEPPLPIRMPAQLSEGSATLTLDAAIFYCEAVNETLCFPAYVRFVVPLTVKADAPAQIREIRLSYTIKPPQLEQSDLGGK